MVEPRNIVEFGKTRCEGGVEEGGAGRGGYGDSGGEWRPHLWPWWSGGQRIAIATPTSSNSS